MYKARFRKFVVIATATLILTSIPSANSATLAGSKCTKLGATKTVSNLKHTCIKSGSKLIWNKGVAVKIVKQPTVLPYAQFTQIERDVYLAMDQIVLSWNSYLPALNNNSVKIISEDQKNLRNEENRKAVELATVIIKDFQPRMVPPVYYTYLTSAWVDKEMAIECPRLVGNNGTGPNAGAQVGCGKLVTANLTGWMNNVAGIDGSWFEAAHETFHIGQVISGAFGTTVDNSKWYPNTPAWYREGSASTFGALVRSLMSKGKINYGEINSFEKSPTGSEICKNAWETWQKSDSATNQNDLGQCEYGLGRRMTDYLVAMYGGVGAVLKNYEYVAQGKSFQEAFKLAHGIELKEFFEVIKPFLSSQGFKAP